MWEIIAAVIGAAISGIVAISREGQAREENYKYNEMSADSGDKRTRALYNDISSPSAQKAQIEKAGLSPSLFYSGGVAGTSGMTGAQGGGGGDVMPNVYGISAQQIAQTKLMEAQARNLDADTDNKREEGKNIVNEAVARIAEAYANAGNKDASTALLNEQKTAQELENYVKSETQKFEISKAEHMANKLLWEAQTMEYHTRSVKVQADVDEATIDEAIRERVNRNKEIVANIALKSAQTELAKQQKSLTDAQESQMMSLLNVAWEELAVHQEEARAATANARAATANARTNEAKMWQEASQFTQKLQMEMRKLGWDMEKEAYDIITKIAGATLLGMRR